MADPVQVVSNLHDLSAALDKASKAQWKAREEFQPIKEEYEDLRDDLIVSLYDSHREEDKRLPGEDVRNAIIRREIRMRNPELYGHYRRLQADLIRVELRMDGIRTEVSANQSILSWLRIEAQATQ